MPSPKPSASGRSWSSAPVFLANSFFLPRGDAVGMAAFEFQEQSLIPPLQLLVLALELRVARIGDPRSHHRAQLLRQFLHLGRLVVHRPLGCQMWGGGRCPRRWLGGPLVHRPIERLVVLSDCD